MATSLLALIDDISSVLDDVAFLTKVAAKKTAGVLGDDLALNAEQVSGVRTDRELAVVWAVTRGSVRNKAILVPAALAISAFAPWAITPLLMAGGIFLCYEGFEKLVHKWLHHGRKAAADRVQTARVLADPSIDLVALERDKIKGAVRTDFVLSAEIIAIALGTVASAAFTVQVMALVGIAAIMTVGVYGLVAGIVKLDDVGLYLARQPGGQAWARARRALGRAIVAFAPWMMKALAVAGTIAMFLVGGGILSHGMIGLHGWIEYLAGHAGEVAALGRLLEALTPVLADALIGVAAGALAVLAVSLFKRARRLRLSLPG